MPEPRGKEGTNGGPNGGPQKQLMGSGPGAERIFNPQEPVFKKDLYSDLQKIEDRGKRKKGFSIFSRNKK